VVSDPLPGVPTRPRYRPAPPAQGPGMAFEICSGLASAVEGVGRARDGAKVPPLVVGGADRRGRGLPKVCLCAAFCQGCQGGGVPQSTWSEGVSGGARGRLLLHDAQEVRGSSPLRPTGTLTGSSRPIGAGPRHTWTITSVAEYRCGPESGRMPSSGQCAASVMTLSQAGGPNATATSSLSMWPSLAFACS
jgi:hypothetical protein